MTSKVEICGECGGKAFTSFTGETFVLDGVTTLPDLSGERCDSCGEVYFDRESHNRYADASNALVLARRAEEQAELRRIRKRLRLSQVQAARLTGGGHNAFSRYERGEVRPAPSVMNLFKLLDKHPELLKELA